MKFKNKKLLTGLFLIILSIIMWISSSLLFGTCNAPSGWDLINSLAWADFSACLLSLGVFTLIIKIGAIILFFVGIFKMVRS